MKLEEIGFYTLADQRAATASHETDLQRCELVLTARCNFNCPYCRHIGGQDMHYLKAEAIVRQWADQGLRNIRFSGGEPTLYPGLPELVRLAKKLGVERVAVSTNGSASRSVYRGLITAGVDDFSVSLDACCAEDGDKMAGGIKGVWATITENIRWLARQVYTTVGVVLTDENMDSINDIIAFADSLGVSDIRVIPAAQQSDRLREVYVDPALLKKYPILKYRIDNIQANRPVRGLHGGDSDRCGLVVDDIATNHNHHYPCIIYMRESGQPIGEVGPEMREERRQWARTHDTHKDPICRANCLDVCVQYNNTFAALNPCGGAR